MPVKDSSSKYDVTRADINTKEQEIEYLKKMIEKARDTEEDLGNNHNRPCYWKRYKALARPDKIHRKGERLKACEEPIKSRQNS